MTAERFIEALEARREGGESWAEAVARHLDITPLALRQDLQRRGSVADILQAAGAIHIAMLRECARNGGTAIPPDFPCPVLN
jgi:hypothetical protein